jgi:hypothetical protein
MLRDALEAVGVSAWVPDSFFGGNLVEEVVAAVDECELVIVFGTDSFGTTTDSILSSRDDLQFALQSRKPIFLIKMCDEFTEPWTRAALQGVPRCEWIPHTTMPHYLIEDIKALLS